MSSTLTRPELPPRTLPVDCLSALYISRQKELYSAPYMNESGEWFCPDLNRSHEISSQVEGSDQETGLAFVYWKNLISLWSLETLLSALEVKELESRIAAGIPTALRLLVYLKVLQIRQKLSHKNTLESLAAHAKSNSPGAHSFIDGVDVDGDMKLVLAIVHLQMNSPEYRNIHPRNARLDTHARANSDADSVGGLTPPNSFAIHTARLVAMLPDISSEERLLIMLKLNKEFDTVDKDALCYQINRTIEDMLPQYFKHLTAQGIDLSAVYTKMLYTFCAEFIDDDAKFATLLDYVVFEGLEFFLRLIVNALISKQSEISVLSGNEFADYISLSRLLQNSIVWQDILQIEPHVIKYENEYHLIHVNSFNKNDHELRNLKEVYHDLTISAYEHEQQLKTLLQSHNEIAQQSAELSTKLHEALEKQRELARENEELRSQYDILSMKENVINTTKANEVFSQRNEELQQLILAAKERVASKKAKVERLAVPATP